jgi:hypothetical protein
LGKLCKKFEVGKKTVGERLEELEARMDAVEKSP